MAVLAIRDIANRRALRNAALDPARIATLYGQQREERRLVRIEEGPTAGHRPAGGRRTATSTTTWASTWAACCARSSSKREIGRRHPPGRQHPDQQLARSGLLGIGRQTYTRKFKILFALLLEARYDKRTILEAYLSQVDLGQRGAQAIRRGGRGLGILVRPRPPRPVDRAGRAADRHGQGRPGTTRGATPSATGAANFMLTKMRDGLIDDKGCSARARPLGAHHQRRQQGRQPFPGLRRPGAQAAGA